MKIYRFLIKNYFKMIAVLVIVILVLISMYVLQRGISMYNLQVKRSEHFRLLENKRNVSTNNFIKIGRQGRYFFSFIAKPSTLYPLFHLSVLADELHCTFDNLGVALDNGEKIGDNISKKQPRSNPDFAAFILMAFTILTAIYGYYKSRYSRENRFLPNFADEKSAALQSIFSNLSYIFITLAVIFAVVMIQLIFNGLKPNTAGIESILFYFLTTFFIGVIFFSIGGMCGKIKNILFGVVLLFAIWFCTLFVLPGIVTDKSPNTESTLYENEVKKLNLFDQYEEFAFNKVSEQKTPDEKKKVIVELKKMFLEKTLKQMKALDENMINRTKAEIDEIHFKNSFFPTTFYSSLACELSSLGNLAYINMYEQMSVEQEKIIKNYLEGKPIETNPVIESKSELPRYAMTGLLLSFVYMMIFLGAYYVCLRSSLFPKIKMDFTGVKIKAKKGQYILLSIKEGFDYFAAKLYNTIFKGEDFGGKITIDKKDITEFKTFYLPDLAGIDIKQLTILSGGDVSGIKDKTLSELTYKDLTILFPQVKDCDVLIIDNNNRDHCIEKVPGKVIFELVSQNVLRKVNYTYIISLDKSGKKFDSKLHKEPGKII